MTSQGSWIPGAYDSFYIHDPKRRLISAAPFRDRVVHHAFCNIIEPVWERKFIHDFYANRKGKGPIGQYLAPRTFPGAILTCYSVTLTIFPSIDHKNLWDVHSKAIQCEKTLTLIDLIISSGEGVHTLCYDLRWFPGDDLFAASRPKGLPIGNLTSQFWANVYLNPFDHFVKRELRCPAYLRYVDDFLLFADDKVILSEWKEAIIERLHTLRLALHTPQLYPVSTGIPFLGFRIYPSYRRLKRTAGDCFSAQIQKALSGISKWRDIPETSG